MFDAMMAKGITREIKSKGSQARFQKASSG
jgi:hypothetical protein